MTVGLPGNRRYDLAAHGVKAELVTGGEAGPTLTLELQGTRRTFVRDQITMEIVGIGTLATVELERESHLRWTDFSLMVPLTTMNLEHSSRRLTVLGVQTTNRFGGSPAGGVQSYQLFELVGTVTLVWWAETFRTGDLYDLRVQASSRFPGLATPSSSDAPSSRARTHRSDACR